MRTSAAGCCCRIPTGFRVWGLGFRLGSGVCSDIRGRMLSLNAYHTHTYKPVCIQTCVCVCVCVFSVAKKRGKGKRKKRPAYKPSQRVSSVFLSTNWRARNPASFFRKRPAVSIKETYSAGFPKPCQRVSKAHSKKLAKSSAEFLTCSFYLPD